MTRTDYLPGLELVKLVALACMLVDHADLVMGGRSFAWTYELGRFALPAFLGAFAVGLARSAEPARSVAALLVPAVLAQFAWSVTGSREGGELNVLFVAAYLAATVAVLRSSLVLGCSLAFVGLAVWPLFEGGWFSLVLFWSAYAAASTKRPLLAAVGLAPVLAVTPGLPAVLGLAAPHLAAFLPGFARGLVPWAWVYAAHLAALACLKAAVSL